MPHCFLQITKSIVRDKRGMEREMERDRGSRREREGERKEREIKRGRERERN